jgi:uncharacterized protein (TIGR02246 family)
MERDEQEIRKLIATWLEATAEGDTDRVLALMSDDAVFLTPGQEPMRGKQAFASSQAALHQFSIEAKSEVQEIRVAGEFAWCWTRLAVTITPPGGVAPVRRNGHTLSILQKLGGHWLMIRDANLLAAAPHLQ